MSFDSGNDIILTDGVTGDSIKLDMMASGNGYGVQSVQFSDGTVWSAQQVLALGTAVTGTTGADALYGSNGADRFDGKGGRDVETGKGGNDTFIYNAGYGLLKINESGATASVLKLGTGISAATTQVSFDSSNDIILTDGVTGDSIKLDLMAGNNGYGVQSVQFADGTAWNVQQVLALGGIVEGKTGADTLYGSTGADTFDGKGGNDVEYGKGGNDTFIYNAGYGHLEISESGSTASVLKLGAGISAGSLVGSASGNNLILTDGVAGDQITIDSMLGYVYGTGIQGVQFADGTTLNLSQLIALETTGESGADVLEGRNGMAEVFDGKGGNDVEKGYGASDTFVYSAGYGDLEISESYATTSVLKLGAGISASATSVSFDSTNDVILTDGITGDRITLDGMANSSSNGVQSVQFADGTVWSAQQVLARGSNVTGTTGADALYGSLGADSFDGNGGNDIEIGRSGNDTFIFNAGYGTLEINQSYSVASMLKMGAGISADFLAGSSSGNNLILADGITGDRITIDNMLGQENETGIAEVELADGTTLNLSQLITLETTGTSGADVLKGRSGIAAVFDGKGGNDTETGYGGNDTFVYNAGYGHLEISESNASSSVLQLGAGISLTSLTASENGNNMILTDGVTGDQITLDNMVGVEYGMGVQKVMFADGTTLSRSQLVTLETTGTTGSDVLSGLYGTGAVFDGKGGNDIEKGYGSDTFVYNAGYGDLEIHEGLASTSVLQLGAGISASAMSVSFDSTNDVILTDGVTGDQITLDGMAGNSNDGVHSVQFADGTVWSAQQVLSQHSHLTGTTGADVLYGSLGSDTFDGQGGNDVEHGNGGNDTYVMQPGYGSLEIVNGSANSNIAAGDLSIENVNPDDIWLKQVGNNLQVSILGSTTEATIDNWFSNTYSKLSEVTVSGGSSGSLTLDSQMNQLIQAMAMFSANNPGFDETSSANPAIADPTLLAAVNRAWHH